MRILYISHCTDCNGATIGLINIIQNMLSRKCIVGIVLPVNEGFLYEKMLDLGVTIYGEYHYPAIMEKPLWQRGFKYYKEYIKYGLVIFKTHLHFLKIIKDFKPDIVHTNTSAIDYALTGCFFTHTPHVWHIREILDVGCHIPVYPSMYILKKKLKLFFNYNIAITKAVYNYYHLREKDKVIYDGVIKENSECENDSGLPFPYFISVGYVNPVKGFLQLVKQFSIFSKSNKDFHLVIVGSYDTEDQYYQECFECILQNKLQHRVHFLGVRNDVYALISKSKALIVASPCEGFGFTCVEAMFCNTLVIGRNTAGIKEQFDIGLEQTGKEIGLRFDKDEQLPEILEKSLLQDYTEMKARAKNLVLDNYTIKKNGDIIFRYYTEILRKR